MDKFPANSEHGNETKQCKQEQIFKSAIAYCWIKVYRGLPSNNPRVNKNKMHYQGSEMTPQWTTSAEEACWNPLGPLGQLMDGLFDLDEFEQTEQTRQTADQSLKTKMEDNKSNTASRTG